ncbi:hypothetical protein PTKIN_Ptkin09bG0105500 [Pterospermum kingtungense]
MARSLRFFPPILEEGEELAEPSAAVIEVGEARWKDAVVVKVLGKISNFSYFCKNRPLLIRKWEPGMKSLNLNLNKVPIWVNLWNVPLELFSQQGLSYIASVLGVPLYMDRFTAEQERLAFAKVCSACVQFGHSDKTCRNMPKFGDKNSIEKKWVPKVARVATTVGNVGPAVGNLELNKSSRVGNRNSVEGIRQQGKASSETRFSILMEEEVDKTNSGVDRNKDLKQPSTIADLMNNIKAQVQESLVKRTIEDKVKGILVQDTLDQKKVDDTVKNKQAGVFNVVVDAQIDLVAVHSSGQNSAGGVPVQGTTSKNEGSKSVSLVENKKADLTPMQNVDSTDDENEMSMKKPLLPISNLVRQPRLASLGVSDVVAAIKAQNKKCRRQVRKASAKKG